MIVPASFQGIHQHVSLHAVGLSRYTPGHQYMIALAPSVSRRFQPRLSPRQDILSLKGGAKDVSSSPKFMWGSDDYFPFDIFLYSLVTASLVVGLPLAFAGPGPGGLEVGMALPQLGGVILSTCAYFWTYYNCLGAQVGYKLQAKGGTDDGKRATDRITGNTLEQMVPFLASLWLYAAYVDYQGAALLGWIYTASRSLYGPLWAFYGQFTVLVEFSTSPAYAVIYNCIVGLTFKVITGKSLVQLAAFLPVPLWIVMPAATLVLQLLCLTVGWNYPTGKLTADLLMKTQPPDSEAGVD